MNFDDCGIGNRIWKTHYEWSMREQQQPLITYERWYSNYLGFGFDNLLGFVLMETKHNPRNQTLLLKERKNDVLTWNKHQTFFKEF